MAGDNIDGNLLAEMILDRYEDALVRKSNAEAVCVKHQSRIWDLEQESKRKDERINALIGDNARLERERDALKSRLDEAAVADGDPF